MEITKINVPVKALSKKCLKCPSLEITCDEVIYGKDVKQYIFECKHLRHCLFVADLLKNEQKALK